VFLPGGPLLFALILLPRSAEPPLVRLAELFARDLLSTSQGRPIELLAPVDRTGRGGTLSLDLKSLLMTRLEGHTALAGRRLRATPVLTETPTRLVLSARITEEPGEALVDIVSTSVDVDPSLLALFPARGTGLSGGLDLTSFDRTAPLDGPVLDLAFVSDERIAILSPESVALYRFEPGGLHLESRQALPGPPSVVRARAGLLLAVEEDTLWALTNEAPRAALYALEGSRLVKRQEAQAIPWPGCPRGLFYRAGTNLLEGPVEGLGPGPFLAVGRGEPRVAVTPEGELRTAEGEGSGARVGPTLAWVFPGILAASSAAPPAAPDALLLFEGRELHSLKPLPMPGSVRALTVRKGKEGARVLAAVEDAGTTYLVSLDLKRREP
jgi:hypothetical protein